MTRTSASAVVTTIISMAITAATMEAVTMAGMGAANIENLPTAFSSDCRPKLPLFGAFAELHGTLDPAKMHGDVKSGP